MTSHKLLSFATIIAAINCTSIYAHTETTNLNDTLPKLNLQKLLPTPPNEYCNANLDSDILYGIGYELFTKDMYPEAKSCFILAAPDHDSAFCYLAIITQYDEELTYSERNTEAFDYLAYSASKNNWCAEYKMYENYKYGLIGVKPDKTLALLWLERSATHGNPNAQELLKTYYYKQGDLPKSHAWSKILDSQFDLEDEATFKKMTQQQAIESREHYRKLKKVVTPKATLKSEALKENISFLSAAIHLEYPETFIDISASERFDYIKSTVEKITEKSALKSKGEVFSYIVIEKHAQKISHNSTILENAEIIETIKNKNLTTTQIIEKSKAIADSIYK